MSGRQWQAAADPDSTRLAECCADWADCVWLIARRKHSAGGDGS